MNILRISLLLLQVQLGSASGIVTKPGGAEPLGGAALTLTPAIATQTTKIRIAISEDDGRFTIRDIEPGEYRLQVQSARFGTAAYGQRKPDGPGSILTIGPGQRLADLKVSLIPSGTIAGRITGRSGEPLAYANVQALKAVYQGGKRVYSVAQSTTTDDRGDYRLFWLTSGKYIVVAGPRSSPIGPGVSRPFKPGETIRSGDPILAIAAGLNLIPNGVLDVSNLTT